jgi:STE24 endopeptidase
LRCGFLYYNVPILFVNQTVQELLASHDKFDTIVRNERTRVSRARDLRFPASSENQSFEIKNKHMQINNSRQQILQAYAKARQTTYRHLSIVAAVLLDLAIFQIPSKPFLQKFGIDNAFHTGIENLFQPFSWQPVAGWHPLQVIIYYGVVSLVLESLYLPVAFHIEYTLPRRFKLGVKTARKTLLNILKKQSQLVVRWAVLIEIAYLLLALQPLFWWFEMALLLSLIMTIKQWHGPSTIRRLFTVTSLPEGELRQRLQTLLARFSIPEPHIAAVDQPGTRIAANAWITGYGKSRLIGFSSTMLKEFSQDEIVVLFAHELGHYVHGDHWRKPVVRLGIRLLEDGDAASLLPLGRG